MVQSAAKPRQRTRADGTKLEPSLEIDVMRMARLAALQGIGGVTGIAGVG